jgi:hypothetical protein
MGHISKPLKVHGLISGTVLQDAVQAVTLPIGVQYFKLRHLPGSGTLRWAWSLADMTANKYHSLPADESTDNIIANPLSLVISANGDDVDFEIFAVVEGK